MINVGSLKVDPVEIEKIILELPEVNEVVVVGKRMEPYGEVVKAVIVLKDQIEKAKIMNHCKEKVSNHKIPKIIDFVKEIPRSKTGKIQRKYLID